MIGHEGAGKRRGWCALQVGGHVVGIVLHFFAPGCVLNVLLVQRCRWL